MITDTAKISTATRIVRRRRRRHRERLPPTSACWGGHCRRLGGARGRAARPQGGARRRASRARRPGRQFDHRHVLRLYSQRPPRLPVHPWHRRRNPARSGRAMRAALPSRRAPTRPWSCTTRSRSRAGSRRRSAGRHHRPARRGAARGDARRPADCALELATRYGDVALAATGFVDASGDAALTWQAGFACREHATARSTARR